MSYIINTKSGSQWTTNELELLKIEIEDQTDEEFFGKDLNLVNISKYQDVIDECIQNKQIRRLFQYINLVHYLSPDEESAVDDYAKFLIDNILEYTSDNNYTRTRKNIKFIMCGNITNAETDICITNNESILFLLQEDKSYNNLNNQAECQIIAKAIAAYQTNKIIMKNIKEYIFPAIVMVGTYPVFYKIPITNDLDHCVRFGSKIPQNITRVYKFNPIINNIQSKSGMTNKINRINIMRSYEAFRPFINTNVI
ncbi:hypothetical protein BB561_007001 [Smittium simulii]|uniref:Uncharacterized protein n=1 Tax=Smittium simulii TaxID=133385 RepID=A0A2T9XY29_9FUNG|nr:hypothetical protein BB561_007001 [Smittium simulii]